MERSYTFLPDTPAFTVTVEEQTLTARVVASFDAPIQTGFKIKFSDGFEGDFISDENMPGGWAAASAAGIKYARALEPTLFKAMKDYPTKP